MDKNYIIEKTYEQANWWASQRINKLKKLSNDTLAINPFLVPLIMDLHGYDDINELSGFIIGGHLSTSYATGFGKLIDEKILPNVFGTIKLSKNYRIQNAYTASFFDEIDHIVPMGMGKKSFLSLKAGKWTIQLTMAVQLNKAFNEIISLKNNGNIDFEKIIIGVFYGSDEALTDKYKIARGICTGARHDVVDITPYVDVIVGKHFWAWLNGGEIETQNWVMEGLIYGIKDAISKYDAKNIMDEYNKKFNDYLSQFNTPNGIDWSSMLSKINK